MKISNLKEKIISCASILVIIAVMYISKIPCFFKAIFKIDCLGCGMTRAYISLLHLNFEKAFEFHPMFWSVPILLFLYLFDGKLFKQKWANTLLLTLIIIGFFANWIIKLVI